MKALGVGLGAFPFHDVEVVRHGLDAPGLVLSGAAAALAGRRGVVRWHLSCPTPIRWRWPWWWPREPASGSGSTAGDCRRGSPGGRSTDRPRSRSVDAMRPVLTVSEMNAVDADRLGDDPARGPGRPGRPGRGPGRPRTAGRGLRATGRRGGRTGQQRRRRPGGRGLLGRRGARTTVVEAGDPWLPSARPTSSSTPPSAPGSAVSYRFPPVPSGTPVLAVDIPSGVRRRHRRGVGSAGAPPTAR